MRVIAKSEAMKVIMRIFISTSFNLHTIKFLSGCSSDDLPLGGFALYHPTLIPTKFVGLIANYSITNANDSGRRVS